MSQLKIKLKVCARSKMSNAISWNLSVDGSFSKTLSQKIQFSPSQRITSEGIWGKLKSAIMEAAEKVSKITPRKRQSWISDGMLNLCTVRRGIKIAGLDDPEKLRQYRSLCEDIQRECRKDKSRYYENLCQEIEAHSNGNHIKDLFQKIKELTRNFKPKAQAVVDAQGCLKTELEEVLEVWRHYCEGLYKDDETEDAAVGAVNGCGEDILVSEVVKAINNLKINKATGLDTIPAEVLKLLDGEYFVVFHHLCQNI